MIMGTWFPKHVEHLVKEKWKHNLPTGLDNLHAAKANNNTIL